MEKQSFFDLTGKKAVVTGGGKGLGLAISAALIKAGAQVYITGRDEVALQQAAGELGSNCSYAVFDLSALDTIPAFALRLEKDFGSVDILVNNAGYGNFGEFAKMPIEEVLGQINLNITALTALTRLFAPAMLERRSGKIMNVASTAGFQPGPLMAVYYATKAYVISFTEAIANELKGSGVEVTCFCPGATETGFATRAGNDKTRLFQKFGPMDVKTVALDGYRGLMKGKTLVISGAKNWLVAESVRFAPRKAVTAISRWITEEQK